MRSFMQTLCHCETNPSDSSPHSGVNTYLNFDLWGKLPVFSSFSLPAWWESRMFSSVRTFYHGATLWSLNPSLRLNGVTSNCIRQMPPLSSPRCKMHLGPEKKYSLHPGPTAGRIHFFSTGCHFTLGLCVCVFCNQRKFLCTPRQVLSRK